MPFKSTLKRKIVKISILALTLATGSSLAEDGELRDYSQNEKKVLRHFLALSDLAVHALNEEPPDREGWRKDPGLRNYYMFFVDSYAVRALGVAYDLTGRQRYLDACHTWTERIIRHQDRMIPAGAYYMNYHRKPGESEGQWFSADSGSIAMGVLATAVRTRDSMDRRRYLDSAKAYVELVMDKFVRDSGGVTDGYWDKSDKEWWCSTALFSSAAFQLYNLTGDDGYKLAALNGVDWLLNFEYGDSILYDFADGAPTTIFYILEAYSSALPYLRPSTVRQRRVFEKLSQTAEWIVDNQTSEGTWDYNPDNWGVKLGGLPCHLRIYLKHVNDETTRHRGAVSPGGKTVPFEDLVSHSTGRALEYFSNGKVGKIFTQKDAFTMMSYAELLCPDELYHKQSNQFPYRRLTEADLVKLGELTTDD